MAPPLRLLSLNLRRDVPADGDERWTKRAPNVARLLAREAPHLLATQEGLAHQLEDVDAALPGHRRVGMDRSGEGHDEHVAIHYDPSRLLLVAWGDLWLSATPNLPGSRSWGNEIPRMLTWARFTDQGTGASFTVVNTHLDHRSHASRVQAAAFLEARFPDAVLMGDFNDEPGGEVHRTLTATRRDLAVDGGTFHGWTGVATERLDWILVPHRMEGAARRLDDRVSDHFALAATISAR